MIVTKVEIKEDGKIEIPEKIAKEIGIKKGERFVLIYNGYYIKISKRKKIEDFEGIIKELPNEYEDLDEVIREIDKELASKVRNESSSRY